MRASSGHFASPPKQNIDTTAHISTRNGKKNGCKRLQAVILRKAACQIAFRMRRHVANMNMLWTIVCPKHLQPYKTCLRKKAVKCVVRHFDTKVYDKYRVCFAPFTLVKCWTTIFCGSRSSTESVDEVDLGLATPCFLEAWEMRS